MTFSVMPVSARMEKKIVTASWDYTAAVWDVATGKRMNVLKGHNGFVQRAVFSPDGKSIITASDDAKVYRWNAITGKIEDSLLMNDYTSSAEYTPDGKKLITAYSHDDMSVVTVWTPPFRKKLFDLKGNDESKYLKGEIYFAGFSPDGKKIVTASADHTAKIWNAFSGKLTYILIGHELDVVSASFSPDNKKLITTTESMAPPIVPSHVFFGETFESGVLPISDPTIYAMVSFIQILAIITIGKKYSLRTCIVS